MMKKLLTVALFTLGGNLAMATDNLKAFPPAETGMLRYVITLPKLPAEDDAKLEIQVGKIVSTDSRNQYSFGGRIETETIVGWGYDRHIVRALGPMTGTRMAVDPGSPKVDRFVLLGGGPKLVRYNSRLPVVVYVPEGVQVRYRIWRAQPGINPATTG